MKICPCCKESKDFSCFGKSKRTSDGFWRYCKQCDNERARLYREQNREKVREIGRRSRLNNPDKVAETKRKYRQNNAEKCKLARKLAYERNKEYELEKARQYKAKHKEKLALRSSEYLKENPHLNRYWRSKRRAIEKMARPAWYDSESVKLLHKRAVEAKEVTGIVWHVDHIVPLTSDVVCGLHWHGNMQLLPASVNQSKSNRLWPDMP